MKFGAWICQPASLGARISRFSQLIQGITYGGDSPGPRWVQEASVLQPVAADSRNRRDGRFIERVGFYNPVGNDGAENLRIALDRVQHWTSNGAQLSPAVERLVKDYSAKVSAAA